MTQHEWPLATSGRYSQISYPVEMLEPLAGSPSALGRFILSVQGQTVIFILVALLVGAGLLMIVPNLSAAANRVPASTSPLQGPQTGANALTTSQAATGQSERATILTTMTVESGGISPVFTPEVQHWAPQILAWSKQYDLDPDIVATIMQIESCGDPAAVSPAGAQGLFQVMPFHFEAGEDMLDPDTNAWRGMAFFNRQLEYTSHDIYLSFAGYNGGYAASGSSYPYWASETQRYFTWAKGIYDDAKAGLSASPTLQQWLQAGGASACQRAAQRLGI
jgi:hypothetical protein